MVEPLSDDARLVLAFIRDHPGRTFEETHSGLAIGMERTWYALKQLLERKQIVVHKIPSHPLQTEVGYAFVFYPV